MAQRSSPSRRVPGAPLDGILRAIAYQSRYSNRRRSDVPTVTNSTAAAASAEAASGVSVASVASAVALSEALTMAAASQPETVATSVATDVALPRDDAATLMVDEDGRATWQYEDRGSVPHVVATVVADQPAVATVAERTATAATVRVWDLSGQSVAGAYVSVAALWP